MREFWHALPGLFSDAWHGHLDVSRSTTYGVALVIVALGLLAAATVGDRIGMVLVLLGAALALITAISQGRPDGPSSLIPRAAWHSPPALILAGALVLGLLLSRNFLVLGGAVTVTLVALNLHVAYAYGTPVIILAAGVLTGVVFAGVITAVCLAGGAAVVLVALLRGNSADLPALLLAGFLLAWLLGAGLRPLHPNVRSSPERLSVPRQGMLTAG